MDEVMHGASATRMEDARPAVTEPRLRRFLSYLEEKRGDRPFAARGDLDPLDFPYLLGEVVLLDVLYLPLRFRYRLVGAGLAGWRGYDLTGKFVHDHPDPAYRAQMLARYREVVETRRITGGAEHLELEGKRRAYQTIRAPLSDNGATVSVIIAAVVMDRAAASARRA